MFEHFDWLQAMRTSPVMILILACSIVTLGFAIERGPSFVRHGRWPIPLPSLMHDWVLVLESVA